MAWGISAFRTLVSLLHIWFALGNGLKVHSWKQIVSENVNINMNIYNLLV